MKWKLLPLLAVIALCVLEDICVNSLDIEKIKSKNKDHNKFYSIFHRPNDVALETDGFSEALNNLFRIERNAINVTKPSNNNDLKSGVHKMLNKNKHLVHANKPGDKIHAHKNHTKRDNVFFRFLTDTFKPYDLRPVIKKKRGANAYVRKLEIISNNTNNLPVISQSILPFPFFGRDRKVNNDKICKTQIFKIFPKQIRRSIDSRYENGNEWRRELPTINDSSNNDWELRQDIFVEEILPFREKSDIIYKDSFHEVKTIFDDILDLFTMLPSFFDNTHGKISTVTPNTSTEYDEFGVVRETSGVDYPTFLTENARNRRQVFTANESSVDTLKNKSQSTVSEVTPEVPKTLVPNTLVSDTIVSDKGNVAPTVINETLHKLLTNKTLNITATENLAEYANTTIASSTNGTTLSTLLNTSNDSLPVPIHSNTTGANKVAIIGSVEKYKHVVPLENSASTDQSVIISTTTQSSKQRSMDNNKTPIMDLLELAQESDNDRYDDISTEDYATTKSEPQSSNKSVFLIILGIVPGLIGLVILVGVIGVWATQKNLPWSYHNSARSGPTTSSHSQPKPAGCQENTAA